MLHPSNNAQNPLKVHSKAPHVSQCYRYINFQHKIAICKTIPQHFYFISMSSI